MRFPDCNCPKAKPRSDGKTVVDAICDKVGECMCPTIADAGEVTYTPNGCVLGGMLFLIDAYFVYNLFYNSRNYLSNEFEAYMFGRVTESVCYHDRVFLSTSIVH